ncbi:AraC family transcriptional regulator, partial [Vibrio parahaemolyticus]
ENVPAVETDKALQATMNALYSFEQESLSGAKQRYWVVGLYQQLAERGLVHRLFTSSSASFSEKLSRYLSRSPGDEHPMERVAERFAMSRATMIRKLKQEGPQYREVLAEVRLHHALYLMQNGAYNV